MRYIDYMDKLSTEKCKKQLISVAKTSFFLIDLLRGRERSTRPTQIDIEETRQRPGYRHSRFPTETIRVQRNEGDSQTIIKRRLSEKTFGEKIHQQLQKSVHRSTTLQIV